MQADKRPATTVRALCVDLLSESCFLLSSTQHETVQANHRSLPLARALQDPICSESKCAVHQFACGMRIADREDEPVAV